MDGNTVIGFCYISELGYCKHCKKIFKYGYNYYSGLQKGEGNCPLCGRGKTYEDIVRSEYIDSSIGINDMFIVNDHLTNNEQKKKLREENYELYRIKGLFKEYEDNDRTD